jgi:gliding motility-associated-like protein
MLAQPSGFLGPDTAICPNTSITLRSQGAFNRYAWSNGLTSSSITVTQAGTYSLQATDNNGCTGEEVIVVRPKECLKGFFAPNAFTPGDNNRKNDVFKPLLYGVVKKFHLQIYDRWGQMVFQSTDYTRGWDGTFKGNKKDPGTYVWVCQYQLDAELVKVEKGTVVLIR